MKSYKQLFESKEYDINIIKDMLLDYTDKDISVSVIDTWSDIVKIYIFANKFKIEECLMEVIDYMKECGLVLMSNSCMWNNSWQYYEGCPNCFSSDFEDKSIDDIDGVRWTTYCNKCGHRDNPDNFLLDRWPVDEGDLETASLNGLEVKKVELYFGHRKEYI